jgi:hypothetical protein
MPGLQAIPVKFQVKKPPGTVANSASLRMMTSIAVTATLAGEWWATQPKVQD